MGLILGKVTKFLVEKLSTPEVISQKHHRGGGVENTILLWSAFIMTELRHCPTDVFPEKAKNYILMVMGDEKDVFSSSSVSLIIFHLYL